MESKKENWNSYYKGGKGGPLSETTEVRILQLAFHDCIPYVDGTGEYPIHPYSNIVI